MAHGGRGRGDITSGLVAEKEKFPSKVHNINLVIQNFLLFYYYASENEKYKVSHKKTILALREQLSQSNYKKNCQIFEIFLPSWQKII